MKRKIKNGNRIMRTGMMILLLLALGFHADGGQSDNSIIRLLSISVVNAEEKKSTGYDERDGIAQIRLVYTDTAGQDYLLKSGCGFFFGDSDTGTYCLTNHQVVTLSEAEKQLYREQFAIESGELPTKIEIVLKKDILITATLENGSQNMDFAILKPDESLKGTTNLRLSEETNVFQENQYIYGLGFQDIVGNNLEVVKTEGILEDWVTNADIHYYRHTIPVTMNNMGGPLLNEQGEVIGINVSGWGASGGYALQISEVLEILQTLGIVYNAELIIDTQGLSEAVQQYEVLKQEDYTEDSWKTGSLMYEQAVELLSRIENGRIDSYTQQEVLAMEQELCRAMEQLEPKGITVKQVLMIAGIVFSIMTGMIIALAVILVKKRNAYRMEIEEQQKKINAEKLKKETDRIIPGELLGTNGAYLPENRSLLQIYEERKQQPAIIETTVLSVETNPHVLCGSQTQGNPMLIRKRTGEKILIEKNSFVLGKSREQTDYCIANNPNISRIHICIKKNTDGFYIQDLRTTNGTYVDGEKVNWDKDVKLTNGCIVRLADEEFEFYC